jgi:lipoprotein-releasing system permease protein
MIGTMALFVVLSAFNGIESLVVQLFNSFDPDLKITAVTGKTFESTSLQNEKIKKMQGVIQYTEVVEENALLKYRDRQQVAVIKGVSEEYALHAPLDSMMVAGDFTLQNDNFNFAVVGIGVAQSLGLQLNDPANPLTVYIPRRNSNLNMISDNSFNSATIAPSGVFSIQQDFDSKYVLLPLRFVRSLLDYTNEVTSVELRLAPGVDADKVQEEVAGIAGSRFIVKNRFEQQELLYKSMRMEKVAVYVILTFILFMFTFNMAGSLSMLIIDKSRDIAVMRSMGATNTLIRWIFMTEGMLITIIGTLTGLALGALICWAQERFGLIKMQGEGGSFVVDAYPVKVKLIYFFYVILTVFSIGFVIAWYAVRNLGKRFLDLKL